MSFFAPAKPKEGTPWNCYYETADVFRFGRAPRFRKVELWTTPPPAQREEADHDLGPSQVDPGPRQVGADDVEVLFLAEEWWTGVGMSHLDQLLQSLRFREAESRDFEDAALLGWGAAWFGELANRWRASGRGGTSLVGGGKTAANAVGSARCGARAMASGISSSAAEGVKLHNTEPIFAAYHVVQHCLANELLLPMEVAAAVLSGALGGDYCPEGWTVVFLGFVEHLATLVLDADVVNRYQDLLQFAPFDVAEVADLDPALAAAREIVARAGGETVTDQHQRKYQGQGAYLRNLTLDWRQDAFWLRGPQRKRYANRLYTGTEGAAELLPYRPEKSSELYRTWAAFDLPRLLQILWEQMQAFSAHDLVQTHWPIAAYAERLFRLTAERQVPGP
eukprot:g16590.t1